MSNFIPIPNSFQLPNVVIDYWMAILSDSQFKVLLAICRKTWGWHKEVDMISNAQIQALTGCSRSAVIRACKYLISIGLITSNSSKNSKGDNNPNSYKVLTQNIYAGDQSKSKTGVTGDTPYVHKTTQGGVTGDTPLMSDLTRGGVSPVTPTKPTITKPTITKEYVVGAVAPPLTSQENDAPIFSRQSSEKVSIEESQEMIHQINLPTANGSTRIVTQSDLYSRIIGSKHNWTTEAIRYAWRCLASYKGVVHDWWRFIEGTVEKYNRNKKSENIVKSKGQACHQSKSYTKSKEISSAQDSLEPPSQELVCLGTLLNELLNGSVTQQTSSSSQALQA